VTANELDRLRPLNFGLRAMDLRLSPADLTERLVEQIRRYDPVDAAEASARVRALASDEKAIDEIVSLYRSVIDEYASASHPDVVEGPGTAAYLRWLSDHYNDEQEKMNDLATMRLKQRLLKLPVIGKVAHALARRLAGS